MTGHKRQFGCLDSLFGLFLTSATAAVVLWTVPSEKSVQSIGGIFQLLGIFVVAWGIRNLRIEFKVPTWREGLRAELPPLWENVKANLRRWLRRPLPTRHVTASGGINLGINGSITASGYKSSGYTVEEQLARLTAEVENVKGSVRDLGKDLARHSEQTARDFAAEAAQRAAVEAKLDDKIASLAVGGLRLETVGVFWLVFGIVLTTWPCEIARWLGARC